MVFTINFKVERQGIGHGVKVLGARLDRIQAKYLQGNLSEEDAGILHAEVVLIQSQMAELAVKLNELDRLMPKA